MTEAQTTPATTPATSSTRSWRELVASTEIDTRLFGMVVALVLIWIGFHVMSHGDFLTSRNLWNLSVQSASIAIMATGMVLIIVSRNIDLSVGSLLGFLGYTMAMVQTDWLPTTLGLGYNRWYTWLVALAVGIASRRVDRGRAGLHRGLRWCAGVHRLTRWVPRLARPHLPAREEGPDAGPTRPQLPTDRWRRPWRRSANGRAGRSRPSPVLPSLLSLATSRRRRQRYDLALRPIGVDIGIGIFGCATVLGAIGLVANQYISPITHEPTGVAYPVVILIVVTLAMSYLAQRRRFGRYVYAYGGNPEAAELGGINTRKTIMYTFVLMGVLCSLSAAVQTARLNAAVTNLGVQNELDVIAAAVIGGTSFSGGIGTIPGAVIGAVIMQSLRSGMVLLRIDSPSQDIVVGVVLVTAVAVDAALRLRRRSGVAAALLTGLIVSAVIIQTGRGH